MLFNGRVLPITLSLAFGALAIGLLFGGSWLASMGGSPYYVIAGCALALTSALLWISSRWALWSHGSLILGTAGWALWESGLDAWALIPRLGLLSILGLCLALPAARNALAGGPNWAPRTRCIAGWSIVLSICALICVAAVHTGMIGLMQVGTAFVRQELGTTSFPSAETDWPEYAGNQANTLFSDLTNINPTNVKKLRVGWTYRFADDALSSLEVTPIKIGDFLYACNYNNVVVALDPETGREIWKHDPHIAVNFKTMHYKCRGVAHYDVPGATGECARRIITSTGDARLLALDALTGRPCQGFGQGGQVSLRVGLGSFAEGLYWHTTAPIVARGLVILGGGITDNRYWGQPSGVIRAFDAVTGKLSWAYDSGNLKVTKEPLAGTIYTPATPNSWTRMAYDNAAGLVYVPTGNATPDFFGGLRRPFDDENASSIMALDIETGRRKWILQTVHHDLWDYDVSSPPVLVDLPGKIGTIKALIQPTKRGETFLVDRLTGKPLDPIVERPAAYIGAVPEERLSSTQPFPTSMPSLSGPTLTEAAMWGLTPLDQLWCRIRFRQARYVGQMTPPGITPSIVYPGLLGGSNWQGVSIDPVSGIMIAVTNDMANYIRLIPRDSRSPDKPLTDYSEMASIAVQGGTPYAASIKPFLSPLSVPCQQPPWSWLTAISLANRQVIWRRPLGNAQDSGPLGVRSHLPLTMGVPSLGGALTTRGGITFVAASSDRTFRAFETATGKLIWSHALPASGHATPMTYASRSGKQFVVIAAGGHKILRSELGNSLVAFTLP